MTNNTNYRIPPRIAVINSFAGYGRCSMTEALPVISAMGVCACPVPTSVFSNHTGFPTHFAVDFTPYMQGYLEQWEQLGLVFDGIYCGYLGKPEQISIVSDFIKRQKEKGCAMVLVDPVMGDHGKAYRSITPQHSQALASLSACADILTPNVTEACLLTDTTYKEDWNTEQLEDLVKKLHAMGPGKIAVTGLSGQTVQGVTSGFVNYVSCQSADSGHITSASYYSPSTGPSRHGTGDIFASILAAGAVCGEELSVSVQKAADFIGTCIRVSEELGMPETDGVCFENFLHLLTPQK